MFFIILKPYYRQAEVEFATRHYEEALDSYEKAAQIQPDPILVDRILKTNEELIKQKKVSFIPFFFITILLYEPIFYIG